VSIAFYEAGPLLPFVHDACAPIRVNTSATQ
jgi:hypothetical protein